MNQITFGIKFAYNRWVFFILVGTRIRVLQKATGLIGNDHF